MAVLFDDRNDNDRVDGHEALATAAIVDHVWCADPVTLAEGTHNIKAISISSAGRSTITPALSVTVDTTAPLPPYDLDLAAEDDNGVSNSDHITSRLFGLTINGRGENGAGLMLFDDQNSNGLIDSYESLSTGVNLIVNNIANIDVNLTVGTHFIRAIQTDRAGNSSAASAPLKIVVVKQEQEQHIVARVQEIFSSYSYLIIADFNGDGIADFARASDGGVKVLLGNDSGGFVAVTYNTSAYFNSVTSADFNGDGHIDLAAVSSYGDSVSVLLSDGSGGFTAAVNYVVGDNPTSAISADFNGDGLADLAVVNTSSNNISVLFNNGSGSFTAAINYASGKYPILVTSADFNGDGFVDLAVFNRGTSVSVLLNDGSGGFGAAVVHDIISYGYGPFISADFNGDGRADLAVSNGNEVLVLLGDGLGGFAADVAYTFNDFIGFEAALNYTLNHPDVQLEQISLYYGDDTGHSDHDHLTNQTSDLTISGIAMPGTVLQLFDDGNGNNSADEGEVLATVSAVKGFWSTDVALAEGTHSIKTMPLHSPSGTQPAASAALLITVDTTVAPPRDLDLAIDDDNGPFNRDHVTSQTSELTISGYAEAEAEAELILFDDRNNSNTVNVGELLATISITDNLWHTDVSLAVGTHFIRAIQADRDGNRSVVSETLEIVVETQAIFLPARSYNVGSASISVTSADFNGDGCMDLAVANRDSDSVSILLNDGSGGFAATVNYAVGNRPYSVTSADFNGDGCMDLAVANNGSDSVSILLNDGSGGFAAAVNYAVDFYSQSVTSADFNGDGRADLAVVSERRVSVLLNNGLGGFAAAVDYAGYSGLVSVTSADFNGDGRADLAIAANYSGSGHVSVLFSTALNNFVTVDNYVMTYDIASMTIGDFNKDSQADLVVIGGNSVSVLLGRSFLAVDLSSADDTGQFSFDNLTSQTSGLTISGTGTSGEVLVLFDDDNSNNSIDDGEALATTTVVDNVWRTDITLTEGTHSIKASSVHMTVANVASSTLLITVDTAVSAPNELSLAAEDDDGLSHSDLITSLTSALTITGVGETGSQLILFDDKDDNGRIGPKEELSTVTVANGVWKADLELAVGMHHVKAIQTDRAGNRSAASAALPIRVNALPSTTISHRVNVDMSGGNWSILDVNGDGQGDWVGTKSGAVSVSLNNGSEGFSAAVDYAVAQGGYADFVTGVDFNGDGLVDLAVACHRYDGYLYHGTISVLPNDGKGGFTAAVSYATAGYAQSMTQADLNGDGRVDLAVANNNGQISVLLNNGKGGFTAAVNYAVAGDYSSPILMIPSDFNGDGLVDLIVGGSFYFVGNGNNFYNSRLSMLLNDGKGGFTDAVDYEMDGYLVGITPADFNGDGLVDLAIANGRNISVLLNDGDGKGGFATVNYAIPNDPRSMTQADFNGDGLVDLAIASGGNISVLLNDGKGGFAAVNYAVDSGTYSIICADFNEDGCDDIAYVMQYQYNDGYSYREIINVLLGSHSGQLNNFTNYFVFNYEGNNLNYYLGIINFDFNHDGYIDILVGSAILYATAPLDLASEDDRGNSSSDNFTNQSDGLTISGNIGDYVLLQSGGLVVSDSNRVVGALLVLFDDRDNNAHIDDGEALATIDVTGSSYSSDISLLSDGTHSIRVSPLGLDIASAPLRITIDTTAPEPPTDLGLAAEDDDGLSSSDRITSRTAALTIRGHGESGATLLLFDDDNHNGHIDDGEPLATTTVTGNSWSADVSLSVNRYDIRAMQIDRAGNAGSASEALVLKTTSDFKVSFTPYYNNTIYKSTTYTSYPNLVAKCDFNGDGRQDLAVINRYDYTDILLLLSQAGGGFDAVTYRNVYGLGTFVIGGISHEADYRPNTLVSGDFNGDGRDDLASSGSGMSIDDSSSRGSSNIVILLATDGGGFDKVNIQSVGLDIRSLVSADFNGDGCFDLASANYDGNDISILLAQKAGGFADAIHYVAGDSPTSIVSGDFNGDGYADIACANRSWDTSVLLGDGSGRFGSTSHYAYDWWDDHVISTADFDDDGYADDPAVAVDVSADFNGDGRVDVANINDGTISILLNTTVSLDLDAEDDNGLLIDDNITSQSSGLTINGQMGDPDGVVTLFDDRNRNGQMDQGERLAEVTKRGDDPWMVDLSLSDGPHAIRVALPHHISQPLMLLVDLEAPVVATAVDNTTLSELMPTLTGTIDDTSNCTLNVQVFDQTSGRYLVRRADDQWHGDGTAQEWTSVISATAADWRNWSVATDGNWSYNHVYRLTTRAIDRAGNETRQMFLFGYGEKVATQMALKQSIYAINPNQTVNFEGQLLRRDDKPWEIDLLGQTVRLQVTDPSGNVTSFNSTTDAAGKFRFTGLSGFNQKGNYKLQAMTDDNLILGAATGLADVRVGPPVGYVILVQGKLQTGSDAAEGLLAHKRSTNRIYQTLLRRGFTADNIRYLNFDTAGQGPTPDAGKLADYRNLPGVVAGSSLNPTSLPTRANIQQAIESWAADKMLDKAAPLYLIMVDHGSPETFYIGKDDAEGRISSTDLAGWLNNLDNKLVAASTGNAGQLALAQDQTVILGSCYSGSFIDNLARDEANNKNRLVISSATGKEKSYRGATEADGIQDGELFLQALFQALARGKTFYEAFTLATEQTEKNPSIAGNPANAKDNSAMERILGKISDSSGQHPLLEDNGDAIGSNALSTQSSQDGARAKDRVLGMTLASQSNSLEHQVQVATAAPAVYDIGTATTALLWAKENNDRGSPDAAAAWVTILSPDSSSAAGTASNLQVSIDLPTGDMNYNSELKRWEINSRDITGFGGFSQPGRYLLQYALRDSETGEVSLPVTRAIYKGKSGNSAPTAATLQAPAAATQVSQIGLFNWDDATDPNGDRISYNLVISADQSGGNVLYRQDNLELSQVMVDFKGLLEQGDYWWRVESVDFYGKLTASSARAFSLTFQNDIPSILQGVVYNNSDYSAVTGATIKLNGQVIGNSESNGTLSAFIPTSGGTLTIEKEGYKTQTIALDKVGTGSNNQMIFGLEGGGVASGVRYRLNGGNEVTAASVVGSSKSDTVTLLASGQLAIRDVETVVGSSGRDSITLMTAGKVVVRDIETVLGSSAADTITLFVGGNTTLIGAGGADKLTGSATTANVYRYNAVAESSPAAKDTLANFNFSRDVIQILASLRSGSWNSSSFFIGSSAFSGTGLCQVRFDDKSKLLEIDLDGNSSKKAEMAMTLTGVKLADLKSSNSWLSWSG
ncbi:MAG: VCBS repeat-containing protein [Magnetococcales bacterium]|nr:VCBS repeat-containing protein [Magnetococcales bacterium]